jgi:hypothetical protein
MGFSDKPDSVKFPCADVLALGVDDSQSLIRVGDSQQ